MKTPKILFQYYLVYDDGYRSSQNKVIFTYYLSHINYYLNIDYIK